MKPVIQMQKSLAVIFDGGLMDTPTAAFFTAGFWRSRKALTGEAVGRGSAWFIDTSFGPVVLRQYLRGGWVGKFIKQSYLFTSVERSRPFSEFRILVELARLGLPVPRPVAALCEHHGVISTGAIMTACILSAQTLADILPSESGSCEVDESVWSSVGVCVRRFHEAGVWHADLNARNILLDANRDVHLIDFDRARFTPGKAVNGKGNLRRLKRSLTKLWPSGDVTALQTAWAKLEAGYYG